MPEPLTDDRALARMRLAWQSARSRAAARGEGLLREVGNRDAWKKWTQAAEAEVVQLRATIAELRTQLATAERQNAELDATNAQLRHQLDADLTDDVAGVPA